MSEYSSPEQSPDQSAEMERYLRFNETIAAIRLLLERGYPQLQSLKQIKEEIQFELSWRQELTRLTPEQQDSLLDSLLVVTQLLEAIEKPRQ